MGKNIWAAACAWPAGDPPPACPLLAYYLPGPGLPFRQRCPIERQKWLCTPSAKAHGGVEARRSPVHLKSFHHIILWSKPLPGNRPSRCQRRRLPQRWTQPPGVGGRGCRGLFCCQGCLEQQRTSDSRGRSRPHPHSARPQAQHSAGPAFKAPGRARGCRCVRAVCVAPPGLQPQVRLRWHLHESVSTAGVVD